ncbi:MAG: hypothetical protein FJ290_27715 [Planctomycetes bacterium]|nr:hypothetical protein [Planctomycetota bacterium]
MTKDEVRTQLSAYLDGELGEAERRAVEAALAADAALRAELDQLRRTAELVRSLPRASAPAGFAARVLAAIAPARQVSRPWLRTWRPAAIAAAACLLLSLALLLLPRPDGERHVARDITPAREEAKGVAKADKAAAPAPEAPRDREGATAADKLEAMGECLARTDDGVATRARVSGTGYAAAPTAPAPGERPALADAKEGWGGRGGAGVPKPGIATERKTTAHAEGERAQGDDARRDLKLAEAKTPAPKLTAGPPAARPKVAATAEAPTEEAAKFDSEAHAAPTLAELREAKRGADEAQDPLAGEKRRAVDRQELMDAIEREYRVAQSPPGAPRRALPPAAGGAGKATAAAGRLEMRLAYADLARCLADWQAALDAANVVYAVRPVGSGEFVIEATLAAPEARALLVRLAGPAKGKEQEKVEQGAAAQVTEPQRAVGAANAFKLAKDAPPPMVHLVLRFTRAEGQDAPPAEPAEKQK